ncbi:MAG: hypothetical protein LC663_05610, partial [Actinobacteria bacterium]|nr:hypothetical protein [Actinomycetota bacterium]
MTRKRFRVASLSVVSAMMIAMIAAGTPANATVPACSTTGCWSVPFQPSASSGISTAEFDPPKPATPQDAQKYPAAASAVVLPNGVIEYWNGLQNLETAGGQGFFNYGAAAGDSKTGVLDLRGSGAPVFFLDANAPEGDDLFCTDQRLAANGELVAIGGTHWTTEEPFPAGQDQLGAGLPELYGSDNQHVLNSSTTSTSSGSDWHLDQNLAHHRWYPTMITQPNGNLLIAGGVAKLLWNSSGFDTNDADNYTAYDQNDTSDYISHLGPLNVVQTETRVVAPTDDASNGTVVQNPSSEDISLPLFARLHVLPNGAILYSGAGQMWGPAGEAYDEAQWNALKALDTANPSAGWQVVGAPALGTAVSGATSTLLALQPPYD